MPNIPFLNAPVPGKYNTFFFLVLVVSGMAGNYFKYPIFLNIDFLFGSIFAILALQFFGIVTGALAAAIIASYTFVLWNHPYAVIIMTAEVVAVGWLVDRRKIGMVLADMIYWLIVGIPLVYLFYHIVMNVPLSSVYITMTKQAVNGITNVLIARLIFTGYTLRTRTVLTSYREIFYNMLILFVLFPTLIILMVNSRNDFAETDLGIKRFLIKNIEHEHLILNNWASERNTAVVNLAGMAATRTSQQMQPHLEQTAKADHNFLRVGLLDKDATTTAYFPLTDDRGNKNIGKNFADRPYIPKLKQTLKPMLSEVVMGKMAPPKPIVTMLAPIVVKGEYNGYLAGVLNLERIKQYLDKGMEVNHTIYTLLDSSGNIIMTNRADQKVMTPFDRGEGTLSTIDARIDQWIPVLPPHTPASERWKKSSYVVAAGIGSLDEWKLILEQPVAPFQKALFDKYTHRLTLLLIILIGALVLAEITSRRVVRALEQLNQITCHLPSQIMNNTSVAWPESHILEVHAQIDNFRETAAALGQQIQEIQKINMSLEELVEERTNALIASEEKHLKILMTAIDGFWLTDMEGHLLEVNETYCRMSGYSNQELLAMCVSDLDVNESANEVSARAHKITTLGSERFESVHRRKDGTVFNVEISVKYHQIETGQFVVFIHDITERKLEHKKRLNSENINRQLLQSTDQSIYGVDLTGRCTFINSAGLNMLGYTIEDCLGQNMHNLIHHTYSNGLPYSEEGCPIFSAKRTGTSCRLDNETFWRKDGTCFCVECSAHPIIENGETVGVVVAFTDTTERKHQEKERWQLERQFQEAQKYECYGVLASGIAHDFNNILTIIMGQCSLAKMDSSNISSYVSELEKAAARGADLCRQLLSYSGKASVTKTRLDMSLLTVEMVNLLKATLAQNIEIRFDCVPDAMVYGDASQISQVVMNLIINASEAIGTGNGNITVSLINVLVREDTPLKDIQFNNINPGRYICLEVTDNGCGMNEEVMQRIFEPFYTTKSTGRGLGTSAILGIVKSHNGALTLKSVPGSGTTFKVFLSAATTTPPLVKDTPLINRSESWKGCGTILLVDDEEAILLPMSYMLKKLGFTVIEANNGKEALECFRQKCSDIVLVLSDIGMPVMSGYDLFRELKNMRPSLPIILSSGYTDAELRSQMEDDDATVFLNKPYSLEELHIVLKEVLK